MKARLDALLERLRGGGRTVRGAGVRRHRAARRARLGRRGPGSARWGKNTCLLHPEHGSWFFLGEIVSGLELPPDDPRPDMCGSCTACLDACPTGALTAPYTLDATRCISYLTIELKGAIPEDRREGVGRHVVRLRHLPGRVPVEPAAAARGGPAFEPRPGSLAPELDELAGLDQEAFVQRFRRSPLKRAKRRGLLRNVAVALGNSGDAGRRPVLERLARDEDPVVREHAVWALRRLDAGPREADPRP